MDKLKPILTHKFWILSVVALILATVGWYLGTSAQAAAIQARIDTLNGLTPKNGATTPNQGWIDKVTVVKADRAEKVKTAADFLWQQQKDDMVWPAQMQGFVAGKMFDSELDIQGLQTYRGIFQREIDRVRQIVDPYEFDQRKMRWEGAVVLEPGTLPLTDPSTWQNAPPTSKEVWYLQEDVWLLSALLSSVRDVNDRAGAESNIIKSPIKQISLIELRGGDRAAMAAGAIGGAGGSGSSSSSSGMEDMGGEMYAPPDAGMSSGFGMSGSGMSGMGGAAAGGVDFNMDEEVGPAGAVATAGSAEGSSSGDMMAAEGEAYAPPMDSGGGGGFGMSGSGASQNPLLDQKRYVDDAPELPYKTRAFKIAVVMDHRQLPEFLVELTNSPFPVNIERVHWAEKNPDPLYASNRGGYSGMGGMDGMDGSYAPPGAGFGSSMSGSRGPMGGASRGRSMMPGSGMSRPGRTPMLGRSGGPMGSSSGLSGGPMGMMSGMEGMDGFGGGSGATTGNDPYSQAMMDPYLADVVIGGVMTIYRSPQDVETSVAEAVSGSTDAAATPAPATPGMTGSDPAAAATATGGAAPAGATAPASGISPMETMPLGDSAPTDAPPADVPPTGVPTPDVTAPPADSTAPPASDPSATAPPDAGGTVDSTAPSAGGPPDAGPPAEPPAVDAVDGPPQ